MGYTHLKSIDRTKNRFRRYVVSWGPTLWGTWGVFCQWGRIGQRHRGTRIRECASHEDALQLAAEIIELRARHGYMVASTSGSGAVRVTKDAGD